MEYYRFVEWKPADIETVLAGRVPQALKAYDEGDKEPLKALHFVTGNPVYNIGGWRFLLRDYLRQFWVKTKNYGIIEVWALNRTDIRKEYRSEVVKIVEVTK